MDHVQQEHVTAVSGMLTEGGEKGGEEKRWGRIKEERRIKKEGTEMNINKLFLINTANNLLPSHKNYSSYKRQGFKRVDRDEFV